MFTPIGGEQNRTRSFGESRYSDHRHTKVEMGTGPGDPWAGPAGPPHSPARPGPLL